MDVLRKVIIVVAMLIFTMNVMAQPQNPPLDGGILWLIAGGLIIGIVTLRKKKNK